MAMDTCKSEIITLPRSYEKGAMNENIAILKLSWD